MSSSTVPATLAELRTDFLESVREATTSSTVQVQANRCLNSALYDMHVSPGSKVPWAERRGVLITHAPYSTGTVTMDVSTSRTEVTGTSTLWTTTVDGFGFANVRAGGKIKLSGSTDVIVVDSVGDAGALTLQSMYTGDDLTDATYNYFEDEYAPASDFLRPVDLKIFSADMHIPFIGRQEFNARYVRNDSPGKPGVATLIDLGFSGSSAPVYRIVLAPPPNDEYQIPYWYVTGNLAVSSAGVAQTNMTTDTDEPIVPLRYRAAIVLKAKYWWYKDYKDDLNRAAACNQEYVDFMIRVLGDTIPGQDRPSLRPRKHRRLPEPGRFEVGDRFDTIRDRYGR